MIPIEDGMKGASPHHAPAKFMDEYGRCIIPETFEELMQALDVFYRDVNKLVERDGRRTRPYRHLGLDSLTGIETLVHNAACGAEKVAHMEAKDFKQVWSACRPYWLGLQRKLTEIRRSGVNVWIIAHSDEDYDASESTGEVFRKSDLAFAGSGKTLGEIRRMWRGWADNIFYLQKKVNVTKGTKDKRAMASFGGRLLVTQETARCAAKSRLNLPPTVPATWEDLAAAMRSATPASPERLVAQVQELLGSLGPEDREKIKADLARARTLAGAGASTALSAVLSRAQGMAELAREDGGDGTQEGATGAQEAVGATSGATRPAAEPMADVEAPGAPGGTMTSPAAASVVPLPIPPGPTNVPPHPLLIAIAEAKDGPAAARAVGLARAAVGSPGASTAGEIETALAQRLSALVNGYVDALEESKVKRPEAETLIHGCLTLARTHLTPRSEGLRWVESVVEQALGEVRERTAG
jgi:hypothetical protein